jgi:CubicO group peptidase (beta-lactamase class C family)
MNEFDQLLIDKVNALNIPSCAAGIIQNDETLWLGAYGKRYKDADAPVQLSDKYHLGSCGKSLTSALVATFVDRSVLSWNSKLHEIFDVPPIHDFTLAELLMHTSGLPRDLHELEEYIPLMSYDWESDPSSLRAQLTKDLLASKNFQKPKDANFAYSNIGYLLLGAVIEYIANEVFDTLLMSEIVSRLGLDSAGFDVPQEFTGVEEIVQPIGHTDDETFDYSTDYGDNHPVLTPAGRLHCSSSDVAKLLKFYLTQLPAILSKSSFKPLLYGLPPMNLPMGWRKKYNEDFGLDVWWQTGTNTLFYAAMCLIPERNAGVFVLSNDGSNKGSRACREIINDLLSSQNLPAL